MGTHPRIGREAGMVLEPNGQRTHDGSQTPGNGEIEDTSNGVSGHDSRRRGREGLDEVACVHLFMVNKGSRRTNAGRLTITSPKLEQVCRIPKRMPYVRQYLHMHSTRSGIATYTLGVHGQIRPLRVSRHRMQLRCCLDKIIQLSNRVDVRVAECLDGEVAGNGEDNDRVEVVRQEASRVRAVSHASYRGVLRCLDTTNKGVDGHTHGDQKGGCDDVHSGAIAWSVSSR